MSNCADFVYLGQNNSYYRTIKRGCIFYKDHLSEDDKESECIKSTFGDENKESGFGTIIILEKNLHNADIVQTSKRWGGPPVVCNIYTCKHLTGIPNIENPNIYKFTFSSKYKFLPGGDIASILGDYELYGMTHVYYCKRCMILRFAIWNKYFPNLPKFRSDGSSFFHFDLDDQLKKNPEITYKNCINKNEYLPKVYNT